MRRDPYGKVSLQMAKRGRADTLECQITTAQDINAELDAVTADGDDKTIRV